MGDAGLSVDDVEEEAWNVEVVGSGLLLVGEAWPEKELV